MEYYAAMKRRTALTRATRRMDPEPGSSGREADTGGQGVSPFIGNGLNRQILGDTKGVSGTEDGRKRMDGDF